MTSLGAELPRQMARVARLAAMFAGAHGPHAMLEEMLGAIDQAAEAIATANVVAYIGAHHRLKAIEP